jgi:hypothetical protein
MPDNELVGHFEGKAVDRRPLQQTRVAEPEDVRDLAADQAEREQPIVAERREEAGGNRDVVTGFDLSLYPGSGFAAFLVE